MQCLLELLRDFRKGSLESSNAYAEPCHLQGVLCHPAVFQLIQAPLNCVCVSHHLVLLGCCQLCVALAEQQPWGCV